MSPPRKSGAKGKAKADAKTCVSCGLALDASPLPDLDEVEEIARGALDVDVDAMLARTAVDDAAMLDALGSQPEIELPLSIDRADLLRVRGHVERAIDALPPASQGSRGARKELAKALSALKGLGAIKTP